MVSIIETMHFMINLFGNLTDQVTYAKIVPITLANSEGSVETVRLHSLDRAVSVRRHRVWKWIKVQINS